MGAIVPWGDFDVHFDGVLGRGGMGSVYRAWQRSVGRWVAVKVLEGAARSGDPDLREGFLQKFRVEIQVLARLNDPRIVTLYQAGETDGRLWFAMELIDGDTVEKRLSEKGAFSPEEAARVGVEGARALDAALRRKIVHRDVKPANIFLLKDGSVKLADFGLARGGEVHRTRLTDVGAVACTPEYASPEQAEGRDTDHRSDLYSLGCVLYEMVTERPPFTDETARAALPPPARALNPKVSSPFESVLRRCLERNPEDRFQSYEELIEALRAPPVEAPRAPAPSSPLEWLWPAVVAAGIVAFAVLLAAIFTSDVSPAPALVQAKEISVPRAEPIVPVSVPAPAPAPAPTPSPTPAPDPPDEESEGQVLYRKGDPDSVARLLMEKGSTRAARRAAAETLEAFMTALTGADDSELVGEIPWGAWAVSPGGEARHDAAAGGYALFARREGERVWLRKSLPRAESGYLVRFRLKEAGIPSRMAVAIDPRRWVEISEDRVEFLQAAPGGADRVERSVRKDPPRADGEVAVVSRSSALLLFLDGRYLFAISALEAPHGPDLVIGAGGSVIVESVRVKERGP